MPAEPLLEIQDVLVAKIETTSGTAESLAAADGVFNVMNPVFDDDIEEIQRVGQGSASRLPSVPGTRAASIKFGIELQGNGASGVPPWASAFLAACGWVNTTGTYAPVTGSTTAPSLTIGKYEDGVLRVASGCRGTWTMEGEPGKVVMVNFEFKGVLQADSDVAMVTPTYPTVIPPRFAGTAVSVGSYNPLISKFTLAANNELYLRPDPSKAAGLLNCCIVDRNPTCQLDPEATIVATRNWQSLLLASTQEALSIVVGSVANNIITLAAPKAQTVKANSTSRNKIKARDCLLRPCRSAAAGDDELTIAFS